MKDVIEEMRGLLSEGSFNAIGVTALARSVRVWAKKLEKQGFTTEVDVFKTGPGGNVHYGPSTVELTLEKEYEDEDGDPEEFYSTIKFVAGGYGGVGDRDIGGSDGWRAMKKEAEKRLSRDPGWKEATA